MRRVRGHQEKSQSRTAEDAALERAHDDGAVTLAMIQALIPLGLKAVEEALTRDVTALAGPRYARDDARPDVVRWGH